MGRPFSFALNEAPQLNEACGQDATNDGFGSKADVAPAWMEDGHTLALRCGMLNTSRCFLLR